MHAQMLFSSYDQRGEEHDRVPGTVRVNLVGFGNSNSFVMIQLVFCTYAFSGCTN